MNPTTTKAMTIECAIHFEGRGRKTLSRQKTAADGAAARAMRVPRVAQLLALAIHWEGLIGTGTVADYASLAKLAQLSRARITQIMNLRLLPPDIQEEILFLPLTKQSREPLRLAKLQPIALAMSWQRQRRLWRQLSKA